MSDVIYTGLLQEALRRSKTPEQTRREADTIESLLDLSPRAHLLDVPCGEGRIGLELAARRYTITGIDNAPDMLAYARQSAAERNLSEAFITEQRDMRDLPWTNEFDGAYALWESFGYFDDEGNRAFLSTVAQTLKPGGRFLFDTHIMETMLPHIHRKDWHRIDDDIVIMEEKTYDHRAGTFTRHWIVVKDGRSEERSLTIRLYTFRELVTLVKSAGFATVEDYSWLSSMPYHVGASRVVIVAGKE